MSDNDDTLTTAEPDTDAGQTSVPAEEAATPATDAPSDGATAQGDAQVTDKTDAAPHNPPDDSGSLTPPNNQTTTQLPVDSLEQKYQTLEKRWRDQQSYHDKQVSQWKGRMERQGQEMTELSRYKQEQEARAKAANLKRYNADHPEHSKFQSILDRRDMAQQQLAALNQRPDLTAEQKNAMMEVLRSPLTDDELREVKEFDEYGKSFNRKLQTNPRDALAPIIRDEFRAMFQAEQQRMQAEVSVKQDFADPALQPLIQEHGEDFARALTEMPKDPYGYAMQMMKNYAENKQLKAELAKLTGKVSQADERTRLVKGEASITRDPRAPERDPYALAKAEATTKGIPLSSPAFAAILAKY